MKEKYKTELVTKFEEIPLRTEIAPTETVIAEGTLEVQKRWTSLPTECLVGGFQRDNGFTSLAAIEHALSFLNGCKIQVIIKVLEKR